MTALTMPDEFIADVFAVMAVAERHTFPVLTKRPARMQALLSDYGEGGFGWPLENVWLGVSIGLRQFVRRADLLCQTPAEVQFISAEPLLGPLVGALDPDDADDFLIKLMLRPGPDLGAAREIPEHLKE